MLGLSWFLRSFKNSGALFFNPYEISFFIFFRIHLYDLTMSHLKASILKGPITPSNVSTISVCSLSVKDHVITNADKFQDGISKVDNHKAT